MMKKNTKQKSMILNITAIYFYGLVDVIAKTVGYNLHI